MTQTVDEAGMRFVLTIADDKRPPLTYHNSLCEQLGLNPDDCLGGGE